MKRILITGANGFVGRILCQLAMEEGYVVRGAVRKTSQGDSVSIGDVIVVGEVGCRTDWSEALDDVDIVIHLASRTHVIKETSSDPWKEYKKVNVDGSIHLAKFAAESGVRRFVYMSSIGVNGNQTHGKPFTEADIPAPKDLYAISKWEAEKALKSISLETGLETVVVRSPLVYGPGVKGNMLQLLSLVYKAFPLPLKAFSNQRSLIGVKNLTSFLLACVGNSNAANQTLLVADEDVHSTPELIELIATAMQRPVRLFRIPNFILRQVFRVLGKGNAFEKLSGSLVVDSSKARQLLNWSPNYSLDEGMIEMVIWYLSERVKSDD